MVFIIWARLSNTIFTPSPSKRKTTGAVETLSLTAEIPYPSPDESMKVMTQSGFS